MASDVPGRDQGVSALEKARERLYAPGAKISDIRSFVSPKASGDLPHAWENEPAPAPMKKHPHVRYALVFFVVAFLFFLVAGGVAAYFLYFGTNTVSVNNVDLAVQGPVALSGGDTLSLAVTMTNRNPTPISNATIDVDFPNGTRSSDNVLEDYPRYTENLGTLAPGQTVTRTIKAVIFGAEGQPVSIPLSLSFGTENSNATFVKSTTYAISITSSPLSVSIVAPSEAVSGQPLTLTYSVRSNAKTAIGNVAMLATYPIGFSVSSTSLPNQNNLFPLGTLQPGDTRTITVQGVLSGTDNSQRAFHADLGTTASPGDDALAITYLSQEADVALTAPFIATVLALNGSNAVPIVLLPGKVQTATISYTNTTSSAVTNAEVDVHISGGDVDYNTIQTTQGFYRSSDHTVVFAQTNDPTLASLQAGASGIGTFSFSTLSGAVSDPSVTFTISVSGTRLGQANVPSQVTASQVVVAKVASGVTLTAKTLHATGPIANSGPIPPTPNTPTTYSIVWDVQDPGNPIAGATISTILPGYVSFTGNVSPVGGAITYDSSNRTVTWNAGDLASGTVLEGAFQVSLTPSTSQEGIPPALTSATTFSGYDRSAAVNVSEQVDPVTTETPSEPGYNPANADVH